MSLTLAIALIVASVAGAAVIIAFAPKPPLPVVSESTPVPSAGRLRDSTPDGAPEAVTMRPGGGRNSR